MKKLASSLLAGTAALALGATALPSATASPTSESSRSGASASRPDDRSGPLTKKQDQLREKALRSLDNGSATLKQQSGGGATVTMAKGPNGGGSSSFEFPVNPLDGTFCCSVCVAERLTFGPFFVAIPAGVTLSFTTSFAVGLAHCSRFPVPAPVVPIDGLGGLHEPASS